MYSLPFQNVIEINLFFSFFWDLSNKAFLIFDLPVGYLNYLHNNTIK